jgi:hypothetical protein
MTKTTTVLVDVQITQLCDHHGLGRHFPAIAPTVDISRYRRASRGQGVT